ncbi:MAG: hypothetical protein CMJ76_01745 [Planctomycetaceae bacterium]|nr:hypothetical protein [Planctomycetaceae bacterium]
MTTVLNVLRDLHRIHQQLADIQERLERCPKLLHAAQVKVNQTEASLQEKKLHIQQLQLASKEQELILEERAAKIDDRQARLKECSSNKEYQTLKDEIQTEEEANNELADKILLAYEVIDQHQAQAKEIEDSFGEAQQEYDTTAVNVGKRETSLKVDLDRIQTELASTESGLPSEFVSEYQRLTSKRGAGALGGVSNNCCGNCYQQITAQMMNNVLTGKLTICGSCGAILYPEE